jgi:LmbE family N-acetylglucosaminyl deacetylase
MVGAHPADCFDQAGGTLAHHAAQGDEVTAVTLTVGVRSHDWRTVDRKLGGRERVDVDADFDRKVEAKLEEVRGACRILGFDDVRALGFDDEDYIVTNAMVTAVADTIRAVRPDLVVTHHPMEGGGLKAHATCGQATVYAWQQAAGTGRGEAVPHRAVALYFMNPMGYMGTIGLGYAATNYVDLLVDVTDVIEKKVEALDRIGSQYYAGPYARKVHETSDGRYGQSGWVAYAEAFQAYRPRVAYTIPVSDADLLRAEEPHERQMARRGDLTAARVPCEQDSPERARECRIPRELYER